MPLRYGTSVLGWAQHRCNTAEGGRERGSSAREQQDEADAARDRTVEQRAQQQELVHTIARMKEGGDEDG